MIIRSVVGLFGSSSRRRLAPRLSSNCHINSPGYNVLFGISQLIPLFVLIDGYDLFDN